MYPLTQDKLKQIIIYNAETGVFTWRAVSGRRGGIRAGDVAGWLDSDTGYWKISIGNKNHLAHRLAWLYMTGIWPEQQIDHCDLNRANNIWTNLRLSTQTLNNANTGKRADNTSGFKGVSRSRDRCWWAQISKAGKHHNLGYFSTREAAAQAYDRAALELFGDFARTNGLVPE